MELFVYCRDVVSGFVQLDLWRNKTASIAVTSATAAGRGCASSTSARGKVKIYGNGVAMDCGFGGGARPQAALRAGVHALRQWGAVIIQGYF